VDVQFAFAGDQVFAEVDREVVVVGQVSSDVDGEEDVELFLRAELG